MKGTIQRTKKRSLKIKRIRWKDSKNIRCLQKRGARMCGNELGAFVAHSDHGI